MAGGGGERRIPETYRPAASLTSQRDLCRGGRQEHTKASLWLSHACVHHETRAPSHTLTYTHTQTFQKQKDILIKIILTPIVSEILPNQHVLCTLWSLQAYDSFFVKFSWFISIVQKDHYTRPFNTLEYCVLNTFPSRHAFPALYSHLLEPFVLLVSLNIFIYAVLKLWSDQRDR